MLAESSSFVPFGPAHLTAIALTLLIPAGLILWARARGSRKLTRRIGYVLAAILVANEIVTMVHAVFAYGWRHFLADKLPFHLCGVAVVLAAWTLVKPKQLVYELAYFWGLSGTLMGVIIPNTEYGFPAFEFIRFFVNHSGIVICVLYATLAMGLRPRKHSVLRLYILTHVYMAIVTPINLLIGPEANYMFLREAPSSLALIFTAPWPWYILILEPVGVVFFTVLYAPFWLARRRGPQPATEAAAPQPPEAVPAPSAETNSPDDAAS